eukprot:CAMPEP_0183355972 /NCGR_PEP_ID=MMETSP0164_2-20130417/42533_1 /TAXON_ID=221442 /ORGANISM="Coccolithus pelagicus ssp braarudi, Strain PLY182g" /LENGTH=214 /DNA_ID=CAMNT_0025529239 /DNA_START=30 /DNA_END=674 /DNA_ORIENTATION=-
MTIAELKSELSKYHAVLVEGPGASDTREAADVAKHVCRQLRAHWDQDPPPGTKLVVSQGDSPGPRGVAGILRIVGQEFGCTRCLVCVDESIDPTHAPNADRAGVALELRYNQMCKILEEMGVLSQLERGVDDKIAKDNRALMAQQKPILGPHVRQFALLQEVTKVALGHVCTGVTIAHSDSHLDQFKVSSFYEVGLTQHLIKSSSYVAYAETTS